jgi:hypothetical protein
MGRMLFALAAAAILLPMPGRAQQPTASSLEAVFLFKFAAFVEWPTAPSPGAPFTIGILGADDVAADLEEVVRGRNVDNRPVVVRRLKDPEALAGLQMVFVGRREAPRLAAVVRAARPLAILVVSDMPQGLEAGSVINFVSVEDRIGFEVSVEAAERSNLKVSSRMLAVARRVVAKAS